MIRGIEGKTLLSRVVVLLLGLLSGDTRIYNLRSDEDAPPLRLSTADMSLCGCYVETMFPLDIGAKVFMTLWLNEKPVRTRAVVATKYPQLGNGFDFVDMSLDDLLISQRIHKGNGRARHRGTFALMKCSGPEKRH
jgi:hypothetical protein